MSQPRIIILPAPDCRCSRKVLEFLQGADIPHDQVALDSPEGKLLMEKHQFRASPGILVNGIPVNPYDILIQEQCRVAAEKAVSLFSAGVKNAQQ